MGIGVGNGWGLAGNEQKEDLYWLTCRTNSLELSLRPYLTKQAELVVFFLYAISVGWTGCSGGFAWLTQSNFWPSRTCDCFSGERGKQRGLPACLPAWSSSNRVRYIYPYLTYWPRSKDLPVRRVDPNLYEGPTPSGTHSIFERFTNLSTYFIDSGHLCWFIRDTLLSGRSSHLIYYAIMNVI